MLKWSNLPKRVEFRNSPNAITKFKKVEFRNAIFKYNVIHDALGVIVYKNFRDLRNFRNMGPGRYLTRNPEIA